MMKVLFLDIDGVLNRQIPDVGFLDDRESQKPEVQPGQSKRDPSVAQKSGNRSGKLRGTG